MGGVTVSDEPLTEGADVSEGFVYFIQQGWSGPVKIGLATGSPDSRLGDLQVGNPERLQLIGFLRGGDRPFEKLLHKHFHAHRIRGEWFEPSTGILNLAERGYGLPWCPECGMKPLLQFSQNRCLVCTEKVEATDRPPVRRQGPRFNYLRSHRVNEPASVAA